MLLLFYLKKLIKILLIFIIAIIISFVILNRFFPLPIEKLEKEKSFMVYDRNNELLRAYTTSEGMWRFSANIENIPDIIKNSIITYEDKRFYQHYGVDPIAFIRALWTNITQWRIVSGFSTITMQIARMIEPKDRTIISKLIEIFRAIQIERYYSKDEIMEIYLNIAPYGGNIEGFATASYIYFNKPYNQLSIGEIALLIGIPNSPNNYRPDRNQERATEQRNKILKLLYEENIISENKYQEALFETVISNRFQLPFYAPHLADNIRLNYRNRIRVNTTIDKKIQIICEEQVRKHLNMLNQKGIYNASVVVIDNESREVVAYVGSGNFFDDMNNGQVNGVIAPRSPGSALKPFLYALACDEGIIGTRTMIMDLPENFSGFQPQNYDKQFRGIVSASESLALSLNLPSVNLLTKLKRRNLYNTLKNGGITTLHRDENHYGLSIILGGMEVRLIELANLYSTLANNGIYRKYKIIEGIEDKRSFQLFSPEASYLVSEMLAEDHHIDSIINWKNVLGKHKIAWKTGTSYSHRDAWSFGYDKKYTIGVWVGNFNNRESPDIVGIKVASPLMFDIFKILDEDYNPSWFRRPDGVGSRFVSAVSGKIPTEFETALAEELYIKGVTHREMDDVRQRILIDKETGYRLYPNCIGNKEYEIKIVSIWQGKLRSWFIRNNVSIDEIPPTHPDCNILDESFGPIIDSPPPEAIYYLRGDLKPEDQQIAFRAHPEKGNNKVYWFINNFPIGSSEAGEDFFYTPKIGTYNLVAMDEEGRTTRTRFSIRDTANFRR